jgi:phospholipase D1/2
MGPGKRLQKILRRRSRETIALPGRNCWRIDRADHSGMLIDAHDYYRAFYHAANSAERYILISGWQFDSSVALLRGSDAETASGPVEFLEFLNQLCERKPDLHIYMLAWDYSMIYGLDREWFQDLTFNWKTNERLKFCYDRTDAFDASHHQKLVVIDGMLSFVGGIDLCASRWDERDHRADNLLRRDSNGVGYRTFHDIQSYHSGAVAKHLAEYFRRRWCTVCGVQLELPEPASTARGLPLTPTIDLGPAQIAICRTETGTANGKKPILEIRQLLVDAVDAAERLIYIENQYCSSAAIANAIIKRMKQRRRARLEIILIIAKDAEAFLEQLSIGIAQSRIIRRLRETAARYGHAFGIYYPATSDTEGNEVPTYIHSKLVLIDDRFLTVGSANMNNRSMAYDTELNVAWDERPGGALTGALRRLRVDLLAEHTGLPSAEHERLSRVEGLVNELNVIAADGRGRLCHHPARSISEEYQWLTSILPDGLPFDSEIAREARKEKKRREEPSILDRSIDYVARFFGGWVASPEHVSDSTTISGTPPKTGSAIPPTPAPNRHSRPETNGQEARS